MHNDQLRIGLIGCGAFGNQRAKGLSEIAEGKLVAVYDPDASRAKSLAREFSATVTESVAELVSIPEIHAVIVASPSDAHVEQTLAAASAGKHVLVEKPAALSLGDLRRMQHACEESGVVLLAGQTLRYHNVPQGFLRSRQDGAIGDPVYFNWASGSNRKWVGGWRGWQTEYERAGGITLHLAIHNIDLALWLLDSPPSRVFAQGVNAAVPGLDVPNVLQISIRCENQSNALVEVQSNIAGPGAMYMGGRLIGTHGQAEWSINEDGILFRDEGGRPVFPGYDQSVRDELRHFIECCRGGAEPLVTADQAIHSLATGIAANRSIQSGDAVDIASLIEEVA